MNEINQKLEKIENEKESNELFLSKKLPPIPKVLLEKENFGFFDEEKLYKDMTNSNEKSYEEFFE